MALKTLDFNSVQRPTLELTLKDDAHTVIRVCTPRTELVTRLSAQLSDLEDMMKKGDEAAVMTAFDLAAELISCNLDHLTVTGQELRGKYGLELDDAIIFFGVYLDFLAEIQNAKN